MADAWRIVKEKHAASAFIGDGAAKYGGRWNSRGVRMIYTSGSESLALLENLVHLNPPVAFRYVKFDIEFNVATVESLATANLPANWRQEPPSASTQALGNAWVKSGTTAILAVPSVIVPGDMNYLLNPTHPDFRKIKIGKPDKFVFDSRLFASP